MCVLLFWFISYWVTPPIKKQFDTNKRTIKSNKTDFILVGAHKFSVFFIGGDKLPFENLFSLDTLSNHNDSSMYMTMRNRSRVNFSWKLYLKQKNLSYIPQLLQRTQMHRDLQDNAKINSDISQINSLCFCSFSFNPKLLLLHGDYFVEF